MLIGALGYYFKASNNQEYLKDASKILGRFSTVFVKNNIITDTCEPSCAANQVPPKGIPSP